MERFKIKNRNIEGLGTAINPNDLTPEQRTSVVNTVASQIRDRYSLSEDDLYNMTLNGKIRVKMRANKLFVEIHE